MPELIGKLTQRSEKPAGNGIKYDLKFDTNQGTRSLSWFDAQANTLEYNHWYKVTYVEKENPNGKYPFKNIIRAEEVGEPEPTESGNDYRVLDQRIAWNSAVNNACHILAAIGQSALVLADLPKVIQETATPIYEVIIAGPPQEAPESHAQPPAEESRPAEPEPAKEKPKANPVDAIRQACTSWNQTHPDNPIKGPEILHGLKVLYSIDSDDAAQGLAELTARQALEMWELIGKGDYFARIEAGVTEAKEDSE